MTGQFSYPGKELEIFRFAVNWKKYWASKIRPYVTGRVLDVGAGFGENAVYLQNRKVIEWCFLEPDRYLLDRCRLRGAEGKLRIPTHFSCGTVATLPQDMTFDTVLYIDVLEHIEGDRREIEIASRRLRPEGHLIVVAPAVPALYSAFDRAIGHFRRYTRRSLGGLLPDRFAPVRLQYLDSVGMLASLANALLLKNDLPAPGHILFWDRVMVPLSRMADPVIGHRLGKTICGVWTDKR